MLVVVLNAQSLLLVSSLQDLARVGHQEGTRVGRQKGVRMGRKEDVSMCGCHGVEGNIGGQLCCNLLVTSLQDLTMVGYQEKGRMGRGERKA